MESGIGFLLLGDLELAAERLAMGLKEQNRKLVSRLCTYGFPADIVEWASQNEDSFASEEQILSMMHSYSERESRDELVVFFTGLYFVSSPKGCAKFAEQFLAHVTSVSTDSYGALLGAIRRVRYPKLSFDPSQNYRPMGERFIKERILHEFKMSLLPSPRPLPDGEDVSDYLGAGIDLQACSSHGAAFLAHAPVGLLIHGLRHILQGRYSTAQALLAPLVQGAEQELGQLAERMGPKKIFIGGYGWSGSGVIYDILRGFPQVRSMFGARRAPFLNEDADAEPMIHQGPGGMADLMGMGTKRPLARQQDLIRFLRLYVLLGPHHDYFEYKTVNCNETLRSELGIERYYLLIGAFMHELAQGLDAQSAKACDAAVSHFEHRIYNSLFPDDSICVLFNNSVNTQNIAILSKVMGNCQFVGVDRNFSDQYLDQRSANQFFSDSPTKFFIRKLLKIRGFRAGTRAALSKRSSKDAELSIDTVFFEQLVTDKSVVKSLCLDLIGEYDETKPYKNFEPSVSARNIGKSRDGLTLWQKAQVATFNAALRLLFKASAMARPK